MPVISRKDLVAKNKAGNGIRVNDIGNNKANNAALLKLADILNKLSANVDDEGLSLNCKVYSDELTTLAKNPINKDTSARVNRALQNLSGMQGAFELKDRYSGTTCYESAVEALGKVGSSKEEFDKLLRTANDVLELGLEKSILKPVDPAELERQRQEQERQRQEQERRRQERERQIQEQQRSLKERMYFENARIRAENEEKLGVVGAFKAESSTQFAAALLAEKYGQKSESKPGEFLQNLKTEAQQRLEKMNMYPEVMTNAGERRIVVSVIKDIEALQESLQNAPAADASDEAKRKFIEETAVQTSLLRDSHRAYDNMLGIGRGGTLDWPQWVDVAIDAKNTLNALYDEKDPAFASKFKADIEEADRKKAQELKEMLYPLDYPEAKEAKSYQVVIEPRKVPATEIPEIVIPEQHFPEQRIQVPGKPDIVIPERTDPGKTIPARTIPEHTIPGNDNPTVEEAFNHLYDLDRYDTEEERAEADPIAMAVDEKGKVYTERKDIINELQKPGRQLFVFKNDGELPLALENRDGKLFASKEGISAQNQISSGKDLYEPKKSLDPKDIAMIPSHKEYEKWDEYGQEPKFKLKYAQDMIDLAETDKRQAQGWLDEHKKPPRLGKMRTLQRWMFKLVTIGFGETNAYKKYRARKDRWLKNVEDNTRKVRLMDERIAAEKAILAPGSDIRKTISAINKKRDELSAAYYSKEPKKQKAQIEEYRKRTEVRMEGVADLIKNGKVNQNNIFANTWLLEQQCKGKKIDDPGVYDNIVKYIASRTVEEKILDETIKDPEYAAARNSMLVESLNNGQAFESLNKSGLFKKVIQDYTDEATDKRGLDRPVDPEKIYKDYKKRVEQKELQQSDPLAKLKLHRQKFIEEFGERPITKDCLNHIAKLNALDKQINNMEETYRELAELDAKEAKLAETGGQLSQKEETDRKQLSFKKAQYKDEAQKAISDLGLNVKSWARQLDIPAFTKPEYKQALEQVHDNLQNAAVNLEQTGSFDNLTQSQRRFINSNVRMLGLEGGAQGKDLSVRQTFKLDEMKDMVNTVVENNREIQKQAEANKQPAGPQAQG